MVILGGQTSSMSFWLCRIVLVSNKLRIVLSECPKLAPAPSEMSIIGKLGSAHLPDVKLSRESRLSFRTDSSASGVIDLERSLSRLVLGWHLLIGASHLAMVIN